MKVTDYIAEFIAKQNVQHVFVLQGGAALHLIDSVEKHPSLSAIAMQHEQSSAMAADGYARASQNLGVTMSTSGPGATNLLIFRLNTYPTHNWQCCFFQTIRRVWRQAIRISRN